MISDKDLHIAYSVNKYVDDHIIEHGFAPNDIGQHIDRVCNSYLIAGDLMKSFSDEMRAFFRSCSEVDV